MFKKIVFYLMICCTIISCRNEPPSQNNKYDPSQYNPVPQHLKSNSFVSSGIDFETGTPVVFDNLSGRKRLPCAPIVMVDKDELHNGLKQKKKRKCEISTIEANKNVLAAIQASKSYTEGTVIRNGKKVKARFIVGVTVLYEGSFCATRFIGGDQYAEVCFNQTEDCKRYKSYIEPYVRVYYANLPENEIKQIILDSLPSVCKNEV